MVRAARSNFFEDPQGERRQASPGSRIVDSWRRSRRHGLDRRVNGATIGCLSTVGLKEAQARNAQLLSHSHGILDSLYEQIRASGSMVILSDRSGVLLQSRGDPDFIDRASRVALRAGTSWSEEARGTNAIGSALVEQSPVEVVGSEHFLDCNGFLTCAAAPIFDPHDRVLGALDISGDYRAYQRHSLGLVRLTSQFIEKRLFEVEFGQEFVLCFHEALESIGTLQEGAIAFSSEGGLLAANRRALDALGLNREIIHQLDFGLIFEEEFGLCVDRAAGDAHWIGSLTARDGKRFFARLHVPASAARRPAAIPAEERRGPATEKPGAGVEAAGAPTLKHFEASDPMLRAAARRAARIVGKDIPLLILGESGVGKERFAMAYHLSGPRRDKPFVALNCAAIPESLFESELFGYVGGAFTGARKGGYIGKIQQACGGTLFLDEIGDMPLSLQTRLLRVLQERTVVPLGGCGGIEVDFSLVCATHRKLPEAVREGRFRADLYFRVSGLAVTLPPLRQRSDLRSLVASILAAEGGSRSRVSVAEDVLALFEQHHWPGNIRELQNVLRVAFALLEDGQSQIRQCHLPENTFALTMQAAPPSEPPAAPAPPPPTAPPPPAAEGCLLETIESQFIERVLAECQGNISQAAKRLGISRNTLYRRLRRS